MKVELWKNSYIDGVQVSSWGRLKVNGLKTTGANSNGYKYFRGQYVHRLVATAFIPNPDNLPVVDHIDRNRSNNTYKNLRWVSLSDNAKNNPFALRVKFLSDMIPLHQKCYANSYLGQEYDTNNDWKIHNPESYKYYRKLLYKDRLKNAQRLEAVHMGSHDYDGDSDPEIRQPTSIMIVGNSLQDIQNKVDAYIMEGYK